MLKTLGRIVIVLLVAGALSGALYLIVNNIPSQTAMGVPPNEASNPSGNTGAPSGAPDQSGNTARQNPLPGQPPEGFRGREGGSGPSPLMAFTNILQNIGIITLVTVGFVVVRKIISRFTHKPTAITA